MDSTISIGAVRPCGPTAVLIEVDGPIAAGRLAGALSAAPWNHEVIDVVPAARTVLVRHTTGAASAAFLAELHRNPPAAETATATGRRRTIEIPVVYDGEDLRDLAERLAMAVDELIVRHHTPTYVAAFCGFTPGFAYLGGLDPQLHVARRSAPRPAVPAGSVAIGASFTAIYPRSSPGGWHLIGRTDAVLWDVAAPRPALIEPGDMVRFVPVRAGRARPTGDSRSRPVAPLSPARAEPDALGPSRRTLTVLDPGPMSTIQDRGRRGLAHLGISGSGAADRDAHDLANRLVGNPAEAATIEVTFGGLALRCDQALFVAVCGAPVSIGVDGGPPLGLHHGTALPAGAVVRLSSPTTGLRTYVAVRGGIDVEPVLGSRSTDQLGGIGPDPLTAGAVLAIGSDPGTDIPTELAPPPTTDSAAPIRVHPGPRLAMFSDAALAALTGSNGEAFTVAAASNRVGIRLDGPPLPLAADRPPGDEPEAFISEGVIDGAIEVSPQGAIILLADHPVTGGYPVIAVVDPGDRSRLAQARPGDVLRFSWSGDRPRSTNRPGHQ